MGCPARLPACVQSSFRALRVHKREVRVASGTQRVEFGPDDAFRNKTAALPYIKAVQAMQTWLRHPHTFLTTPLSPRLSHNLDIPVCHRFAPHNTNFSYRPYHRDRKVPFSIPLQRALRDEIFLAGLLPVSICASASETERPRHGSHHYAAISSRHSRRRSSANQLLL